MPLPQPTFQTLVDNSTPTNFCRAVLGRGYQVQYTTDLGANGWTNLGRRLTATNSTLTATHSAGDELRRFYRVLLAP